MTDSPKLPDQVRSLIRLKHYSFRTEQTYVGWIKRYIFFHNKRHPKDMGEKEIRQFLTHLAVNRNVASSTQNQAFNALLFLYREVLKQDRCYTHVLNRGGQAVKSPGDMLWN